MNFKIDVCKVHGNSVKFMNFTIRELYDFTNPKLGVPTAGAKQNLRGPALSLGKPGLP